MEKKQGREERRREVCGEYRASGKTQKAFCEENGVALSTLTYWLRKERKAKERKTEQAMVPVGFVDTTGMRKTLRITIDGGIVLEVDLPVSARDLETILLAVKAS